MSNYSTPHGIEDEGKLEELISSMIADGWQGAPLVKWGESDLITGTHRYYAAREAGIEIPVIDLEDLFAEAGLDFAELHADYDEPTLTCPNLTYLLAELPEDVIEFYGIQWG